MSIKVTHRIDVLPGKNFIVKNTPGSGFFLQPTESFTVPNKLYGDTHRHTERIIRTFNDRPSITGVLLSGEKGSGKTLLAKNISIELAKSNAPTLLVAEPFYGDDFNSFLQSIKQPCVIIFDEFEKVYGSRDGSQAGLLSLLDGTVATKKLCLLTVNDTLGLNQYFHNRPGRIYYALDFQGVTEQFVREYCQDRLKDPSKSCINDIVSISKVFRAFNFDQLSAMVEEINRYNESPYAVLNMLNIRASYETEGNYKIELTKDEKPVRLFAPKESDIYEEADGESRYFYGNPLTSIINTMYWTGKNYCNIYFRSSTFAGFDEDGALIYKKKDGFCLKLVRENSRATRNANHMREE